MERRHTWMMTGLALVSMLWLIGQSVGQLHEGLAMLAPALLLLLPLLAGRYLGERAIERLRAGRAPHRPRRRPHTPAPRLRPSLVLAPRGGALLGASLATRPPPAQG